MSERHGHDPENAGSDPDSGMRRSGGSANDPHGGYESGAGARRAPDPDPVGELATIDDTWPDNRPDDPTLSTENTRRHPNPGFGPKSESAPPPERT